MIRRSFAIALVTLLASAAAARGQGEFYRVHLLTGQVVAGRLGEISRNKVVVTATAGTKEFNVNEIKYLQIPGEPRELMQARDSVIDGTVFTSAGVAEQDSSTAARQRSGQARCRFLPGIGGSEAGDQPRGRCQGRRHRAGDFSEREQRELSLLRGQRSHGRSVGGTGSLRSSAGVLRRRRRVRPWPEYKLRAAVATGRR